MAKILSGPDLAVSQQMAALADEEMEAAKMAPLEEMLAADPVLCAALEELVRKEHQLLALKSQAQMEAIQRDFQEFNASDGMGSVRRVMPAFAWHDIAHQMGGTECFEDKSFNRYLDRKAPETKVKAVGCAPGNGMKLQVGWEAQPKRFTKSFGIT